jgi:hypothetical protein
MSLAEQRAVGKLSEALGQIATFGTLGAKSNYKSCRKNSQ